MLSDVLRLRKDDIKTGGLKKWKKESLVCGTVLHTQPATSAVI